MKILCDEDGKNVIVSLCDIALKSGGIKNLEAINAILGTVKLEENETSDLTATNDSK